MIEEAARTGIERRDGTHVVVKPEAAEAKEQPPSLAEWLAEFIGCIDGPADLAENHDYYAHGAPKGIDKL